MDALCALRAGQVALVCTDTVYGLAAVVGTPGYERIFELKQRPRDQVLPWLVNGADALDVYACDVPDYARTFASAFWPGPLTLVVRASDAACALSGVAADGTVALRCPDDESCRFLLSALDVPIACTSANVHGQPACSRKEQLDSAFAELPGFAQAAQACSGGSASTIVDCTSAAPRLLRSGPIALATLLEISASDGTLPA